MVGFWPNEEKCVRHKLNFCSFISSDLNWTHTTRFRAGCGQKKWRCSTSSQSYSWQSIPGRVMTTIILKHTSRRGAESEKKKKKKTFNGYKMNNKRRRWELNGILCVHNSCIAISGGLQAYVKKKTAMMLSEENS